jgi:serine/threonine-protein phosphatase 6 regulatory ankyrin repeat subunit B
MYEGMLRGSKILIRNGADINIQDKQNETPLHYAAKNGHTRVVQLLMDERAQFWLTNKKGETALLSALKNRCETAAQLLIKPYPEQGLQNGESGDKTVVNGLAEPPTHEKYLNTIDSTEKTALAVAIENDMPAVALEILNTGADLILKCSDDEPVLTTAIWKEYTDVVQALLKREVDPDAFTRYQEPLYIAASRGYSGIVELILKIGKMGEDRTVIRTAMRGASENGHLEVMKHLVQFASREPSESFTTNLHHAFMGTVCEGHEDVAEFLLGAGADINHQDPAGNTPLQLAAFYSHLNIVRLLLLRRADLELQDRNGSTALSDAAYRNSADALEMLLAAGANKETENEKGNTPIMRAVSKGHVRAVELLIKSGVNLEAHNKRRKTALTKASSKGYVHIMELLIDAGADLEAQNEQKQTPLMIAVSKGHKGAVELLVNSRAKLDTPDSGGATPVMKALNQRDILNILLGAHASIDSEPVFGTILHRAAFFGETKLIKTVLDNRYDVNSIAGKYGTALQAAAYGGEAGVVELLLKDYTADIDKAGGKYFTAIQAAVNAAWRRSSVVRLLLEYRPNLDLVGGMFGTALHAAAAGQYPSILGMILNKKPSRYLRDVGGRLALHLAAWRGSWDTIQMICDGEDPLPLLRSTDNQGRTGMHFAATGSNNAVIEQLWKSAADSNVGDKDGWTPLHWACRKNSLSVVEYLLDHGADPQRTTRHGWTPAHVAIFHGQKEILPLVEARQESSVQDEVLSPLTKLDDGDESPVALPSEVAPQHNDYSCDSCYCVSNGI